MVTELGYIAIKLSHGSTMRHGHIPPLPFVLLEVAHTLGWLGRDEGSHMATWTTHIIQKRTLEYKHIWLFYH